MLRTEKGMGSLNEKKLLGVKLFLKDEKICLGINSSRQFLDIRVYTPIKIVRHKWYAQIHNFFSNFSNDQFGRKNVFEVFINNFINKIIWKFILAEKSFQFNFLNLIS